MISTTSISNKVELPEEWKELIFVPIYKKGDKTDYINYRRILIFANYVKMFIENPAFKVISIRKMYYIVTSVWISTQQVNY
jgi:hypothetical protein